MNGHQPRARGFRRLNGRRPRARLVPTEARSADESNRAFVLRRRGWLPSDAAGAPRERVASASAAATTFYQPGITRPAYPGQRELMGEILYGDPGAEHDSPRRSRRAGLSAFAHAAGLSLAKRVDRVDG